MSAVREGDLVALHYELATEDGHILASTRGKQAEPVRVGGPRCLPGLSRALLGMEVGQRQTVRIAAREAFGAGGQALMREVERRHLPANARVGDALRLSLAGTTILMWIVGMDEERVRLSSLHPLAGRDLVAVLYVGDLRRE
jgi:FKBP-type peptidyl-prolyl cis-trans isomerase 2